MIRKVLLENKNARCYILASFIISIGTGIFFLTLNLYLKSLGVKNEFIGFINGIYYLGIAVLALLSGLISNIAGHKRSFAIGTMLQFLGEIGMVLSKNGFALIIFIFLIGFGSSLFLVNEAPFLSRNSTSYEQTHLFGLSFGSVVLGNFIGEILGSFLPKILNGDQAFALRSAIIIAATLTILGLLFIIRIDEEWVIEESESIISKIKDPLIKLFNYKKNFKIIGIFAISEFLMGIGAGVMVPFFNLYFIEYQGIGYEKLGIIFGAQSILIALASFFIPYVVKKFKKFYSVITLESLSLPFIILLLSKNKTLSIISYLLRGIFINASIPVYTSYYMDLMEDEIKAIASSVKEISWNLAWFIGSLLFAFMGGDYKSAIVTFFLFYTLGILSFSFLTKKNAKIMIL
ncbi:major facilitator superfamily protein [Caldisericum exile AZM16c01]|uniref:Major facilitator superfamily protein n=2 Tax=Caldisericum exile TaxID=693075 RepID=A0A7U6JEM1_CALEA|nr:MFS transporter [Caldisericum exile]BAL80871.1 major facilitator superfamily protein [Caldisericum exile AZM16c01]